MPIYNVLHLTKSFTERTSTLFDPEFKLFLVKIMQQSYKVELSVLFNTIFLTSNEQILIRTVNAFKILSNT